MESVFLRMRVVPSSAIFCSSLILMLPGICLVCFSKPFFISPSAPITTGIVLAFILHIRSISISRSLYFDSFSVTLTEVFFSVGMDILLLLLLIIIIIIIIIVVVVIIIIIIIIIIINQNAPVHVLDHLHAYAV